MIFDLEEAAAQWRLDPDVVHANHGSFGAVPLPVLAEQQRWQARLNANPSAFFRRDAMPAIAAARQIVGGFLGADADGMAFVRNSTEAINAIVRSHNLSAGDEVIVFDQEYQAVTMAVHRAARAVGARVVEVPVPLHMDDGEILGRVSSSITANTRMLVVDHITSATARTMPVAALAQLCREQAITSVIDASHVPGVFDPQIASLGADYWFGNLHKWLCAPVAAGVLYVAPQRRAGFRPLITSWFDGEGFPAALDMLGTIDYSAWLAAPSAIDFFSAMGWQRVRQANHARALYGRDVVAEALGVAAERLRDYGLPMSLVPLDLEGGRAEAEALYMRLALDYKIESAITEFAGSLYVRVSGQLYNTAKDYSALAGALREVLGR